MAVSGHIRLRKAKVLELFNERWDKWDYFDSACYGILCQAVLKMPPRDSKPEDTPPELG